MEEKRTKEQNTADCPSAGCSPAVRQGLLTVSVGQLMRLRHNPFFGYMEERLVDEIDSLFERKPWTKP
jgi:hypothetical protein